MILKELPVISAIYNDVEELPVISAIYNDAERVASDVTYTLRR